MITLTKAGIIVTWQRLLPIMHCRDKAVLTTVTLSLVSSNGGNGHLPRQHGQGPDHRFGEFEANSHRVYHSVPAFVNSLSLDIYIRKPELHWLRIPSQFLFRVVTRVSAIFVFYNALSHVAIFFVESICYNCLLCYVQPHNAFTRILLSWI